MKLLLFYVNMFTCIIPFPIVFREDITRVQVCINRVDLQEPSDDVIDDELEPFGLMLYNRRLFSEPPPLASESSSNIEV